MKMMRAGAAALALWAAAAGAWAQDAGAALLGTWRHLGAREGAMLTTFAATTMSYKRLDSRGVVQAQDSVPVRYRAGGDETVVLIDVLNPDGTVGGGLIALMKGRDDMRLNVPGAATFRLRREPTPPAAK